MLLALLKKYLKPWKISFGFIALVDYDALCFEIAPMLIIF